MNSQNDNPAGFPSELLEILSAIGVQVVVAEPTPIPEEAYTGRTPEGQTVELILGQDLVGYVLLPASDDEPVHPQLHVTARNGETLLCEPCPSGLHHYHVVRKINEAKA